MDVALAVSSLDFTSGLAEHLRGGHVFWAYALLAATTAPPLVPNSVLLVTGGVLAAEGRLNIALVLLVVAGSALTGDLLIHWAGHAVSGRVLRRTRRRPRQAALLKWAALRIQRHGVPFVIGIRFLPSGRVIGGLAAGVVRYPARRYAIGAGAAELVWASYSVGVGYFSGREASNGLYAVTWGVGISVVIAGLGTAVQWMSRSHERRQPLGPAEEFPRLPGVARSVAAECEVATVLPAQRATGAQSAMGTAVVEGGPKIGPPSASPDEDGRSDVEAAMAKGRFWTAGPLP